MLELRRGERLLLSETGDWAKKVGRAGSKAASPFFIRAAAEDGKPASGSIFKNKEFATAPVNIGPYFFSR
jgi:hypothetical protein